MTKIITQQFENLFRDYPLHSQNTEEDPLVVAKLFDIAGSATWFLCEFDPKDKVSFGYVTGLVPGGDEWGYISVPELEQITHPLFPIPRIERDLYFNPVRFSVIKEELERGGVYVY